MTTFTRKSRESKIACILLGIYTLKIQFSMQYSLSLSLLPSPPPHRMPLLLSHPLTLMMRPLRGPPLRDLLLPPLRACPRLLMVWLQWASLTRLNSTRWNRLCIVHELQCYCINILWKGHAAQCLCIYILVGTSMGGDGYCADRSLLS